MATHISPVVLRQEVGRRIRLARQATGHTIVEAAARLEITRSALSRFDFVALETAASRISVYEIAMTGAAAAVRDSKNAGGPILVLPVVALSALLDATR